MTRAPRVKIENTHVELLEEFFLISDAQEAVTAVDGVVGFVLVRHRQDVAYFELQLLIETIKGRAVETLFIYIMFPRFQL